MTKFMHLIAAALAAGTLMAIAPAPAAFAGTTRGSEVTATAQNATVWSGGCGSARYGITVQDSWADWEADVTIRKPGGGFYDSDWLFPGSRNGRAFLCSGLDRQGAYQVRVHWTAYNSDFDKVASETVTTSFKFTVRKKLSTRLTAKPNHVRHGFWTITGGLTRAGRPFAAARVAIQAKYRGSWWNLKTKRSNRAGIIRFTSEPKPGAGQFPLRLHYDGNRRVQASNSRIFRVYP